MEIEIKYQLPAEKTMEAILKDEDLLKITEASTIEEVPMLAVYYDTIKQDLNRAGIVMRVRREGDTSFCTIKWGGEVVDGVHRREEENIPIPAEDSDCIPDWSMYGRCEKGSDIEALLQDSVLIPLVKMDFLRNRRMLEYRGNQIELALDRGIISSSDKSCKILELELEHYKGSDPLTVLELGEIISDKYGLTLQTKSKYARGLELLKSALQDGQASQPTLKMQ